MATARRIRPAHASLLDAFEQPLAIRAGLADLFANDPIPLPEINLELIAQGGSVLTGDDLARLEPWLLHATRELLPVLESSFPNGEPFRKLATAAATGELSVREASRALLDGDAAKLEALGNAVGVPAGYLMLSLQMIAGAAIAGLASQLGDQLESTSWSHGSCPVCGSSPSLATLSRKDDVQVEALVGGGGKKHLHCGLCGHSWRFQRNACAGCGNEDPHSREVFYAERAKHERIETCSQCKGYLLCVDLREYEKDPNLQALPLALVHLDIIAQEKGFGPLSPATWNTFS